MENKQLKISSCDDEEIFRNYIKHECEKYSRENSLKIDFVEYRTGKELIQSNEMIDLLFLDIELSDYYVMDVLEKIRKKDNVGKVVLATSHMEEAINGYGEKTIGFLTKPFEGERIKSFIEKVRENKENSKVVSFQVTDGVRIEPVENILYIEAAGNYVKVVTLKDEFLVHITMKNCEDMLNDCHFIRVYKSYIVNMENIEILDKQHATIKMKNKYEDIKIGKVYKNNFISHYEQFKVERAKRRLK